MLSKSLSSFYYQKPIIELVRSYVEFGYKTYSELDCEDQQKIAATCINILGEDAYSCIVESDNFNITLNNLKNYLFTSDTDYALDMAENMRKCSIDYFREDLDQLFMEKYAEHEDNYNPFDPADYPQEDNQVISNLFFV